MKKYTFIRYITRIVGLVPVFMGTNASFVNFVSHSSTQWSRTDILFSWCYVVHKLSPYSVIKLKEKQQEIMNKSNLIVNTDNRKVVNVFIDRLFKLMKNERPLFIELVICFLNTHIEKIHKDKTDILEMFEKLINYVCIEFRMRKKTFIEFRIEDYFNYNFANLSLTAPEYWRENSIDQDELIRQKKDINEYTEEFEKRIVKLEKTSGIHNHIAYLHVPSKINEPFKTYNFFGLTLLNTALAPIGTCDDKNKIQLSFFKAEQVFAAFCDETVGQIAFIGKENFSNIFLTQVSSNNSIEQQRISCYTAMKNLKTSNFYVYNSQAIADTWILHEASTALSALIATLSNGFKGIQFDEWLCNFIRECTENDFTKPTIEFCNDEYWNINKSLNIPYCSSSINGEWNNEFAEYLVKECNADMGILQANELKGKRDFSIRRIHRNEVEYPISI